ncbi:MAG: TSUP family transporter [Actinomycetales bacterium]
MELEVVLFLVVASGFAGLVDSIAGGGGLIQLPSLLVALPNTQPSVILGTNKLPSSLGTATATVTYLRRLRPNLRIATMMAVPAFIGSALGARVATLIPKEAFRPIILLALIGVFTYTLVKKDLGLVESKSTNERKNGATAIFFGLVIGFYDGIFGPGTGTFLMLILVGMLGYAFLEATVTTKIVNLSTNIGAILMFGISQQIMWTLGLTMAIGNVLGGLIGARLAIRGGSKLIRRVFLFATALLIARLAIDTFF